jgi:hypothetical protein
MRHQAQRPIKKNTSPSKNHKQGKKEQRTEIKETKWNTGVVIDIQNDILLSFFEFAARLSHNLNLLFFEGRQRSLKKQFEIKQRKANALIKNYDHHIKYTIVRVQRWLLDLYYQTFDCFERGQVR